MDLPLAGFCKNIADHIHIQSFPADDLAGITPDYTAAIKSNRITPRLIERKSFDLLDHVVVSEEDYVSMKDNGFLRDT